MNKFLKISWTLTVLLAIAATWVAPASSAQMYSAVDLQPGPMQFVRLDPRVRQRYVPPPPTTLSSSQQAASANIVVNYIEPGWTTEAKDAFEFAVQIWENLITSPVTIVVDADFDSMGANILGGATPMHQAINFPNAPMSDTWYPVATANKLAGSDLSPGVAEIFARFNSDRLDWDFGIGNSTLPGKINFVTVVLHELGHGLGFLGSMAAGGECGNPNRGCYGIDGDPFIYDRFVENGAGTALLTFQNNSTALGDQLTSGDLYFNSPGGNSANGDNPVRIYAPSPWKPGSSYSHLDESFNNDGSTPDNSLMTYSIAYGETIHHPGSVTLCMFEEMGWTVSETCSGSISGLAAANDGPTLLGTPTQFIATIVGGSDVTYEWDFDDGETGSGAQVSHLYASLGTYDVEVTATNEFNQESAHTTVYVVEHVYRIFLPLHSKQP